MHLTLSWPHADARLAQFRSSEWSHTPSLPQQGPRQGHRNPGSTGNRPALPRCFQQLQHARFQRRGGAAAEHAHPPKYTCIYLHMQIYTHHCLKTTFEDLWATNATSSFLQYASNSCQKSGIRSGNIKFSYIISESLFSLLEAFSDVQLCFLYTKVQYFLHKLCKQTQRRDFESTKKKKKKTLNESNRTTHFLLPAFVLLRTPLLRSS